MGDSVALFVHSMTTVSNWSLRLRKQALDLGLYGHTAYTRFIILGRSRVGSNMLRSLLNAHPQIAAFGEMFRTAGCLDWDHLGYFQSEQMGSLLKRAPVTFVERKVFGRYPRFIRAAGFKLFYYHARSGAQAAVWSYLRELEGLRILHLRRRNVLKAYVSRQRAASTRRWVDTSNRPERAAPIRLDYERCLEEFRQTRAWEEEADRMFAAHPVMSVEFEKLALDHRAEMHTIQEFLHVTPRDVNPSTFPQSRQPLSATISNYAELREEFSGTVWEEFFDDE